MLVSGDAARRDLEDTLRSLGAVLDRHMARAILIKEVEAGLIVRARVSPSKMPYPGDARSGPQQGKIGSPATVGSRRSRRGSG